MALSRYRRPASTPPVSSTPWTQPVGQGANPYRGPNPWQRGAYGGNYYGRPTNWTPPPDPESEARYTRNYYGQNRADYATPEDMALRHRDTMIPTITPAYPDLAIYGTPNPYTTPTLHNVQYGSRVPYQAGVGFGPNPGAQGAASAAGSFSPVGRAVGRLHSMTTTPGPQMSPAQTIPPEGTVQMGYPDGMVEPPPAAGGGGYGYYYPDYGGGGGGGTSYAGGRAAPVRRFYGQQSRPSSYSAPRYAPNVQAGRGGQLGANAPRWFQELVSWRGV